MPAVPIRRSVSLNKVSCLDYGWSRVMLKRHLSTAHGANVEDYRTAWALPANYPMVAPLFKKAVANCQRGWLRPASTQTAE